MDQESTPPPPSHGHVTREAPVEAPRQPSDEPSGQHSNQPSSSVVKNRKGKGKRRVRFSLNEDLPEGSKKRSNPDISIHDGKAQFLRSRPGVNVIDSAESEHLEDGGGQGSSRWMTSENESRLGGWETPALVGPNTPWSSLPTVNEYVSEETETSERKSGGNHKENVHPSPNPKGAAASTAGTGMGWRSKSRLRRPFPSAILKEPRVAVVDIPLANLAPKPIENNREPESEEEKYPDTSEAQQLVRFHSRNGETSENHEEKLPARIRSGAVTPEAERDSLDYVPPPQNYHEGILASLLKLYRTSGDASGSRKSGPGDEGDIEAARSPTPGTASVTSSPTTPRSKSQKWYSWSPAQSTNSITGLLGPSPPSLDGRRKTYSRLKSISASRIAQALSRLSKPLSEDETEVVVNIALTLDRQRYLLKLCRALIAYGAPTHRLEEYMKMTARKLEVDGQFLYIPGCMIISFDDASTHTTEVRMVRNAQGVDLGKLRDTHEIYKAVIHGRVPVDDALRDLDEMMNRKPKRRPWVLVFMYGLASALVGPFAFQARLIDMPIAFFLGTIVGFLQLILAPKSELYSNVFEISAAVFTSFLARAFGTIGGGDVFCFSALAQSAIAMILPGYIVLCGSPELQSKSIVAGSVRIVYAIIYSLFLGFGITIGTAIYGLLDPNATSSTTCKDQMPPDYGLIFVPPFILCLITILQAQWIQAPVMILIAFAGYIVNFFSSKLFPSNAQVSTTVGAFAAGLLGNLYSSIWREVAAATLLPAIFVQLPSGLAASGSLVSGVRSADQLINTIDHTITPGQGNSSTLTTIKSAEDASRLDSVVVNVGLSMVQVTIGITVGLFLSMLIVYPIGKRRTGLFSF